MDANDAARHCAALVRAHDRDRYVATLYAPDAARPALFALYAFAIEAAHVRDAVREPMAGEIRLQWWREALSGARPTEAAAHPVAAETTRAIARLQLDAGILDALFDARAHELHAPVCAALAEAEDFARTTTTPLTVLASHALGWRDGALRAVAEAAGLADGLTGMLHDFARDAASGRVRVPEETLGRHGASSADVLAGETTAGVAAALREMRGRARAAYAAFAAEVDEIPALARPAFLPLALIPRWLDALDAQTGAPFTPVTLAPWRAQWTMWRAARRGVV